MTRPIEPPNDRNSAKRGNWEVVRAFAFFSLLALVLLAVGGELAFQAVRLRTLAVQMALGRSEALFIARSIAEVARDGPVLDYTRIRRNRDALAQMIQGRIDGLGFVRRVEVHDRFGQSLLRVGGPADTTETPLPASGKNLPQDETIRVELPGREGRPEGEVRLDISQSAVQRELDERRQRWLLWFSVFILVVLGILFLAFAYVLHLIRRGQSLERQRQEALRAAELSLLASGLAHEIRNPLNAMNINLQMLEEELFRDRSTPTGEHHELLNSTLGEIRRVGHIVEHFLSFARPPQTRPEPRELNEVVASVVRFLDADFKHHGVTLRAELGAQVGTVELDETQFKQALINLLVNARQIVDDGGHVTLRTIEGSAGDVCVEVEDDGPGIDPEARDRVFQVFYSKRKGGTGLGLPIAKQIVERHGGTIEVESEPGRGATFRIRIPRRAPTTPWLVGERPS